MRPQAFRKLALFIWENFAPLLVFYGVNHFYGLKPAIVVSVVYSILEVARYLVRQEPLPPFFQFTAAVTLIFGFVDLYAQQTFLFRFEAAVTNVFTGLFFLFSLRNEKSLIQEFYERSPRAAEKAITPEIAAYFRFFTVIWAAYFFGKAAVYAYIATRFSIEESFALRAVIGTGSFYALLGISIFGGRKIFMGLQRFGLFTPA